MGSKVTLEGKLLFPNDYLAAVEFKGKDVTLTIETVKVEGLRLRGGAKEAKPVVTFKETKKKLVINKTNADSIATMYGSEAKAWAGKKVTLYPTKTTFGRETVDCIRVRETTPNGSNKAGVEPPSEEPPPPSSSEDGEAFLASLDEARA